MEAIIRVGGQQYKAIPGKTLDLDFDKSAEPGANVEFEEVLYVKGDDADAKIGTPTVAGAKVVGKVVGPVEGPKLAVMKFRRRKNSKTRAGHRQAYTRIQIESVQA